MIRLFVRFAFVTLVVTLVSVVLLMVFYQSAQDRFVKPRVVHQMDSLASLLEQRLDGLSVEDAQTELDKMAESSGFRGRIVRVDDMAESDKHAIFLKLEGKPYLIELKTNETVIEHINVLEGLALIAAMAAMIGLAVGSGLFLAVPLVRKLRRQEKTVLRIAEGDLTARVAVGSRDALGRLGERINSMAERIQELVQSHRELIRTISHEMRTPLARLQFSLEMLQGSDGEQRRERIASMQEDIQELDELLEELLTFQRLEAGTLVDERENVDLLELLDRITHRAASEIPEIGIRLTEGNGTGSPSPQACCNERLLTRAIENVVRNAVRFAKKEVVVSCEMQSDMATICVVDDGPGVTPEDRERIFDPFVTLSDRCDGSASTGLGLAIARHIINDHGGTIAVEDHAAGGALFKICLPVREFDTN